MMTVKYFCCRITPPRVCFCVQVVLPVWSGNYVKSLQYVRQLHTVPGRHHRRHSEAGHAALVQGVRAVPAATQALGQSCPGIEGAAHAVHQAPQRPHKGMIQHLLATVGSRIHCAKVVLWPCHHHDNVLCHIHGIALSTNEPSSVRSSLKEERAIELLSPLLACAISRLSASIG